MLTNPTVKKKRWNDSKGNEKKQRTNIKMKYKKTETKLFPKYENSEFPLHYRVEFLRNGKFLL